MPFAIWLIDIIPNEWWLYRLSPSNLSSVPRLTTAATRNHDWGMLEKPGLYARGRCVLRRRWSTLVVRCAAVTLGAVVLGGAVPRSTRAWCCSAVRRAA
jgi:hypothetical protein